MKSKYVFFIIIVSYLILSLYGISKRDSYTNITQCENPRECFQVATFQDAYIKSIEKPEIIEEAMYEVAKNIVRVEALSNSEFVFKTSKQNVLVKDVICGNQELKNKEIVIVLESGIIFSDDMSINMGFCNEMKVGEDYLVYISDKAELANDTEDVYFVAGTIVAPIFAYNPRASIPVGGFNYISYSKVKDYEYFAQTEKGIEALLNLRQYVMKKWNQN